MTNTMSSDLLLLSSQNECWDDAVGTVGVESLNIAAEPAKATTSLDDYLQNPSSVTGFTLSIPSHKSLPADMSSESKQMSEDEGSCDLSVVSDLTQMTYRAELMKQVSSERAMTLHADILAHASLICSGYFMLSHQHNDEGNCH